MFLSDTTTNTTSSRQHAAGFVAVAALVTAMVVVTSCSSSDTTPATASSSSGTSGSGDDGGGSSSGASGGGNDGSTVDTRALADKLRERLAKCDKQASTGLYKTDDEDTLTEEIPICEIGEAYFWHADMDVDCDGLSTATCNEETDPAFQPATSVKTSTGEEIDATKVPYVVVPNVSSRFDYDKADLPLGTVIAVVYGDKVEFGVFADLGPVNIIGEASHAMAKSVGINPDPSTGGTPQGEKKVLYIAFKGQQSVLKKPEDHNEAVQLGTARLKAVFPGL